MNITKTPLSHVYRQSTRCPRSLSTTAVNLDSSGNKSGKTLGRHPRSITAPLAAFTMALLLASYCVSSIRAARREARYHPSSSSSSKMPHEESIAAGSSSGSTLTSTAWISKALEEEKRENEKKR